MQLAFRIMQLITFFLSIFESCIDRKEDAMYLLLMSIYIILYIQFTYNNKNEQ